MENNTKTLNQKKNIKVIFINPVEYHGPHLPLSTDFDISEGLFNLFQEKVKHAVNFLPHHTIISKGCAPAHGVGSESIERKELSKIIIRECEKSIREENPDFVLFMTAHGAPTHAFAIEDAIEFLKRKNIGSYNPFNHILKKMRDYKPELVQSFSNHIIDSDYRKYWEINLPEDFHGGTIETALILYFKPSSVKPNYKELNNYTSKKPSLPWKLPLLPLSLFSIFDQGALKREWKIATFTYYWEKSPHYAGYTGGPKHANAELGKALANKFIEIYLEDFNDILCGVKESPKPIFKWVALLEKIIIQKV